MKRLLFLFLPATLSVSAHTKPDEGAARKLKLGKFE